MPRRVYTKANPLATNIVGSDTSLASRETLLGAFVFLASRAVRAGGDKNLEEHNRRSFGLDREVAKVAHLQAELAVEALADRLTTDGGG